MRRPRHESRTEAAEVVHTSQRIADLEDEVTFWQGETSDHDHEREAMFNRQQAVMGAATTMISKRHTVARSSASRGWRGSYE